MIMQEPKGSLEAMHGERLQGIYLYGWYAWGGENSESDVDVLVILDRNDRYRADVNRTEHLVSQFSLKYVVRIS